MQNETIIFEGALSEVLQDIAEYLELDADELIAFAELDRLGGHFPNPTEEHNHPAPPDTPPQIANKGIWENEGKVLYALIRALQPLTVLEIGNGYFCSTAHLGEAVMDNGIGHFYTVDIRNKPVLLDEHKPTSTQIVSDLFWFDYCLVAPIDFCFEDSYHTPDMVEHVWRRFMDCAPLGGVIVSHDAAHFRVGPPVREGIERITYDYRVYQIEPALCGLAIGRKT